MSKTVTMTAETREGIGKGAARATRRAGRVPAVIYGDKKDPETISLDPRELLKQINKGTFLSTLFDLQVNGKANRVIPRDVQYHPVTDQPLHVDFLRLGAGARIAVEVPVHFLNEDDSPGIKRGGVLNVVRHEVELDCPADAIPEFLEADLTGLDIGDSIHISAITLPEGITPTITDRDFTVATVAAPAGLVSAEAEEEEGEEAEGEAPAEEEEASSE